MLQNQPARLPQEKQGIFIPCNSRIGISRIWRRPGGRRFFLRAGFPGSGQEGHLCFVCEASPTYDPPGSFSPVGVLTALCRILHGNSPPLLYSGIGPKEIPPKIRSSQYSLCSRKWQHPQDIVLSCKFVPKNEDTTVRRKNAILVLFLIRKKLLLFIPL